MELVSTMEINGEEREIADAVAREQCEANAQNIATNTEGIAGLNNNLDGLGYGENGVYNLLNPKLLEAVTKNGVTCTPNKDANGNLDGTYTLNGTNSGTWTAFPFAMIQNLGGTFKFVVRNNVSNVLVFIWNATDSKMHDTFRAYKEVTFDANKIYSAQFVLEKDGAEVNGLFKPMLTADLKATYDDFKPYIPSVKMLADEVSAQNESLSALGKCKNLLNPTLQTTTVNGITCTDNGDGTYALNGTATADLDLCIKGFKNLQLNKEYKMLGCPSGGSDSTYMLYDSSESDIKDIGKGKVYTPTKQPNINIRIMNGVTVNNLVFKPMLTTNLSATYDDFVPYTGDGETLTADVAELKNDLSDSLPVGTILTVVDSATMSSDMWKLLKTGTLSYQDGGALVEISTITYQKIK